MTKMTNSRHFEAGKAIIGTIRRYISEISFKATISIFLTGSFQRVDNKRWKQVSYTLFKGWNPYRNIIKQ